MDSSRCCPFLSLSHSLWLGILLKIKLFIYHSSEKSPQASEIGYINNHVNGHHKIIYYWPKEKIGLQFWFSLTLALALTCDLCLLENYCQSPIRVTFGAGLNLISFPFASHCTWSECFMPASRYGACCLARLFVEIDEIDWEEKCKINEILRMVLWLFLHVIVEGICGELLRRWWQISSPQLQVAPSISQNPLQNSPHNRDLKQKWKEKKELKSRPPLCSLP